MYANWAASAACETLTFSPVAAPPAVPQQKERAFAPDGRTMYLATDPEGRSTDSAGVITRELINGGSILEFSCQDHP